MPQPVIEVERLTKRFGSGNGGQRRQLHVLSGADLRHRRPQRLGKTVLLKCILGLMPVTAGRIRILGAPVDSRSLAHVGMIIEAPGFLPGYDAFRNPLDARLHPRQGGQGARARGASASSGSTRTAARAWANTRSGCGSGWQSRRRSWRTRTSCCSTSR